MKPNKMIAKIVKKVNKSPRACNGYKTAINNVNRVQRLPHYIKSLIHFKILERFKSTQEYIYNLFRKFMEFSY
jgi:hypothetical protein